MTSLAWVDQVFNAPPARDLKGPAKYTQAFRTPTTSDLEGVVDTQGYTETAAALLFDYFRNRGLVGRFKAQPFVTVKAEFGAEICPDFLVEVLVPTKAVFIVEIKTEGYLDDNVRQKLDDNRRKFAEFGLPYLVWTDQEHLGNVMTLNLDMWRVNGANVPNAETDTFSAWLRRFEATTIGDAVRAGFTLDVIEAAAWRWKAFMPLNEATRYDMLLTPEPQDDLMGSYFELQVAQRSWWSKLATKHRTGVRHD
ncbi:hypothetical protein [Pseudoduganella sp. RAF19]|uniref:hypothetical protein n=3 Tax=unclassified Pseudoduganella TaxID=2637179 RepID=UPI003F975CF2